ncbi:MAG: PH domain-containing protein [Clostridia bacterium]|nr:PH domain-containing protein [Clostridia bacterium]
MAIEYIWADRKRILGMPLTFTRYRMSEDRLFLSTGFFTVKDEEILLYRVRDISLCITLWQRIFGVGTVTIISSDKTLPTLVLKNIKQPRMIKEKIHQQVEEMKIRRRMRIGEIMTDQNLNDDDDTDLDRFDEQLQDNGD